MRAGIIAAGEGSRLKADGVTVPKPLVCVDGIPLIERLIRTFIRNGITEIFCIVNEESIGVKRFLEDQKFSVPVLVIVKSTSSSMHSLFALAPYLAGHHRFLLSTVDAIYAEDDFRKYITYAQAHESEDGILAVTNFIDDERPLFADLGEDRSILKLTSEERFPWTTGGLYIFSPNIFREVNAVNSLGIERLRNFLDYLIAHGYRMEGFPFAKIVDVDRVRDIHVAEEFLRTTQ